MQIKGNIITDEDMEVRVIKEIREDGYVVYKVNVKKEELDIHMWLVDFVYVTHEFVLTENEERKLVFDRPDVRTIEITEMVKVNGRDEQGKGYWEVENKYTIDRAGTLCNKIKQVVRRYYRDAEIIEWHDYKRLKSRLDLYRRSFGLNGDDKGAEYFYNYEMDYKYKHDIFKSFQKMKDSLSLEQYIQMGAYREELSGGNVYGCYTDSEDRVRPLTSRKTIIKVPDLISVLRIYLTLISMPEFVYTQLMEKHNIEIKPGGYETLEGFEKLYEYYHEKDNRCMDVLDIDKIIRDVDEEKTLWRM